ncbi:CLUMA_CG019849, isoform A [Clunio marinus]|uniref:CLUMA_CG019849, isoform A n=1 Tax=Clunio marinus TaxID=568069 RepID=A0A1J1J5Y5_9DIPT|nr:CLUMA_CG019849, isoform A [Clunio marinus]
MEATHLHSFQLILKAYAHLEGFHYLKTLNVHICDLCLSGKVTHKQQQKAEDEVRIKKRRKKTSNCIIDSCPSWISAHKILEQQSKTVLNDYKCKL